VATVQIVAALFVDDIAVVPPDSPGGPTTLTLTGVRFSLHAPAPPPVTLDPHMVVLVRCGPDEAGTGVLEVTFHRDGEQIARNVQPLQVEPGKFSYRLVRAELELPEPGTVEARARIDAGPETVVPLTLLPPAS
jgi:hypothetical protein